MAGNTWGQMSSQTYKDLRVPTEPLQDQDADGKPRPLYNPLTDKYDIKFTAPRILLSSADAREHLGHGTRICTTTPSAFTLPTRLLPVAWPRTKMAWLSSSGPRSVPASKQSR